MRPRSVKMKRFIFGFQRRVWWPKWTPASSNSFMETTGMGAPFFGLDWHSAGGAGGQAGGAPAGRGGTRDEPRPPSTVDVPPGRRDGKPRKDSRRRDVSGPLRVLRA